MSRYEFEAGVWLWKGNGPWHFITLPESTANQIKKDREGVRRIGWGSIPVSATVASTTWKTSIFPDKKSNSYLLPVKADVRKKEGIEAGQSVQVSLQL